MKTLETIFLILTIAIPLLFVCITILKSDKFKRVKKTRVTLIKLVLLSFLINGITFGAIKMYNNNQKDLEQNDFETPPAKSETSDIEQNENTTSKGFEITTIDGLTYIDGILIVNKTYPLPEDYIPTGTYKEITTTNCAECLDQTTYDAYLKMKNDAKGLTLWLASGYRSYTYQDSLYQRYVNRSGKEAADTYSARPGHSEHQTGLAFDLNTVSDEFADTKEGKWIGENCYKYGFIIRYPKGKEGETGYKYEPWHLRYVGVYLATKLYNAGDWITLESYFGITSKYAE